MNLPATGLGEWDFVMCSYTNGMLCDGVFRNGVGPGDTQCETQSITIYTAGQGASVGSFPQPGGTTTSPFIGAIDSVQVLAKFLSPAEVCNTAGLPGC